MTDEELKALASLRFDWTLNSDDVWAPLRDHVTELNRGTARRVLSGVQDAERSSGPSPLGLVVEGDKGAGKTHLLTWVREQVHAVGGYFFVVGLSHGDAFWTNVVESMLEDFWRKIPGEESTQLDQLLTRLGERAGTSRAISRALTGQVTRPAVDNFVAGLSRIDGRIDPAVRDAARALVLYASLDPGKQDLARTWLTSSPDLDTAALQHWGIQAHRTPQRIVRDLSRLLALTAHTVIALDQVDPLIARASTSPQSVSISEDDEGRDEAVGQVADGVMALREVTQRTLTVLTCLPNSWQLISTRTVSSVRDRFRDPLVLKAIERQEIGRKLVSRRLGRSYGEVGFKPPYPTWPIKPEAFAQGYYTPRALLRAVDAHVQACLDAGSIVELADLEQAGHLPENEERSEDELSRLDEVYERLRIEADVDHVLDEKYEDEALPALLAAGLTAWIEEQGNAQQQWELDAVTVTGAKPPLHARLRLTVDEDTETEHHWAFRSISSKHGNAQLPRMRSAIAKTGIQAGDPTRKLFLLRNTRWSEGAKTQQTLAEFEAAGGRQLEVTPDDLRTLTALKSMLMTNDPVLRPWLSARRPAGQSKLLRAALGDTEDDPEPVAASPTTLSIDPEHVHVGHDASAVDTTISLASLRKHAVVFAGSGSGKTVLIRRMIEEAALRGVSTIVLDPNNDLARLGDRWPVAPAEWDERDVLLAEEYHASVDVQVWTPLRNSGQPLSFQPLPDFRAVLDDTDEFQQMVEVAVTALIPRARAEGGTGRDEIRRAVLRQSLEFYARSGGSTVQGLVDVMKDLPPEASVIDTAERIAAEMAQTLTAAMVNDPLFAGTGTPLDPAVLLRPPAGKRARVSVVNLIGIQDEKQRQAFVSQLQMALFTWFKQNPALDRPLGGLLVMDEAQTIVPSGSRTPSTESTLALASQARKYGLGLIFATQAPRGLHNRVPGNASTQFFGRLTTPTQIQPVRELARAMGGDVPDIGALRTGDFYLGAEGRPFGRFRSSMCLSHHGGPLTTEEVLERARQSAVIR